METFRPVFRQVDITDKDEITRFLRLYPQNEGSECTFSNLFIWAQSEDIRWAVINDCLLLQTHAKNMPPRMLMAFAPQDLLGNALDASVEAMESQGVPFMMSSLPAWYCDLMSHVQPGRFAFEREPHHDDYVYETQSLITLSGKKLHAKRNHINRFMADYGDRYTYEPYHTGLYNDCMDVYSRWLEGDSSAVLMEEKISVQRGLQHADALGLVGGVLRIDGRVEAFTLGERITHDMALIHIEKASFEIPGLFTMINREFAANALSDMTWINREEDMGIEGLRHAKRSYNPARMVEKFGAILT